MPFFDQLPFIPEDPILSLSFKFLADPRPTKVNLGVGVYRGEDLAPYVPSSVRKAEALLLQENLNKEYLPIQGDPAFNTAVAELILGSLPENLFVTTAVGGTGALRLAGSFLHQQVTQKIFLPDPTWDNHDRIFSSAGLICSYYPHSSPKGLDFEGVLGALHAAPPKTAVLFHACCHNPSGYDPTLEQWDQIASCCLKKELFPLFDLAYQGFGSSLEEDVAVCRLFLKRGLTFFIATSLSKSFGLYGERVGALLALCSSPEEVKRVGSQLKFLIRGAYSNPPLQGERIVVRILRDAKLRALWESEVAGMRQRIRSMREAFVAALKGRGLEVSFLLEQRGMFLYTELKKEQIVQLTNDFGIYLPSNGRINAAGLNSINLPYVADAIASVYK